MKLEPVIYRVILGFAASLLSLDSCLCVDDAQNPHIIDTEMCIQFQKIRSAYISNGLGSKFEAIRDTARFCCRIRRESSGSHVGTVFLPLPSR